MLYLTYTWLKDEQEKGGKGMGLAILVYICSMAGIYIHIPFCRSKCFYCGFYSVASLQLKKEYVEALCREVELRKNYLSANQISTLYFGGGTPSCLEVEELGAIVACVRKYWNLADDLEFCDCSFFFMTTCTSSFFKTFCFCSWSCQRTVRPIVISFRRAEYTGSGLSRAIAMIV